MEALAAARDEIEDWQDDDSNQLTSGAEPSAPATTSGFAGRFDSYLGVRPSEVETGLDAVESVTSKPSNNLGGDDDRPLFGAHDEQPGSAPLESDIDGPPLFTGAEEVLGHGDGTFTGGPLGESDAAETFQEDTIRDDAKPPPVIDEDSSGDEAVGETQLPDEPWHDRPPAERELWERVRPRTLRREAVRVKDLKFPLAPLNRLMRLHPDLQSKTPEAAEIINCATVLLLQSIAQSSVRGRKATGQTVRLEDVKQVCSQNKELQFLLPLSATLDASTLTISRHEADDAAGKVAGSRGAAAVGPGQSTLSTANFARTAAPPKPEGASTEADVEDGLDVVTVQGNLEQKEKPGTPQPKQGNKRKLPPSAKKEKSASKAPRQAKEPKAPKAAPTTGGSSSIASFFKRAEPAVEPAAE